MNNSETPELMKLMYKSTAGKESMCHRLWLVYSQLKDAEGEADNDKRLELLSCSREELGELINEIYRAI